MNEEWERAQWAKRQSYIWGAVVIGLAVLTVLIFWLGQHGTP